MVNEYIYCPRLVYLKWVQGEWGNRRKPSRARTRTGGSITAEAGCPVDPRRYAAASWKSGRGVRAKA